MARPYHHGDLRAAFLARAAEVVADTGIHGLSLRAIAAEIGVSHTAPRHHFGSRNGLVTALATEGYHLLADAVDAVLEAGGTFADTGVAYVRFADEHPGYFTVMFGSEEVDHDDPQFIAAEARAFASLRRGVAENDGPHARVDFAAATIASWSLMHGLVTLHRSGALERTHVLDLLGNPSVVELARRITGTRPG